MYNRTPGLVDSGSPTRRMLITFGIAAAFAIVAAIVIVVRG